MLFPLNLQQTNTICCLQQVTDRTHMLTFQIENGVFIVKVDDVAVVRLLSAHFRLVSFYVRLTGGQVQEI